MPLDIAGAWVGAGRAPLAAYSAESGAAGVGRNPMMRGNSDPVRKALWGAES